MSNAQELPGRERVRWVECPRDAWQSVPELIPAERKVAHLQGLLDAGFRNIDAGSFVSPRAVPQLASSEEVLAALRVPAGAELLAIVANGRGVERALAAANVTAVGYPLSVNETFQLRNSGMTLEQSWEFLDGLVRQAREGGLELVVYLSMGFGNPYGDPWEPEDTARAARRLARLGVHRLALADTIGNADEVRLAQVLGAVEWPGELGLHLHARPHAWQPLLETAWSAGVRWFEGALSGLGGCPFAGDELVGNLPTEKVLPWLAARATVDVDLEKLPGLAREARGLAFSA